MDGTAVTLQQGNWAYGYLSGVNSPLTIIAIIEVAKTGVCTSLLPSTSFSKASNRLLTLPKSTNPTIFPLCLLGTKSSMMYISSRRRITSLCQSGQEFSSHKLIITQPAPAFTQYPEECAVKGVEDILNFGL